MMLNVRTIVGCDPQKQQWCTHEKRKGKKKRKTNLVHHHLLNRLLHILNFLSLKTINQHHLQQQQQQNTLQSTQNDLIFPKIPKCSSLTHPFIEAFEVDSLFGLSQLLSIILALDLQLVTHQRSWKVSVARDLDDGNLEHQTSFYSTAQDLNMLFRTISLVLQSKLQIKRNSFCSLFALVGFLNCR